jgi:hypothetical protein
MAPSLLASTESQKTVVKLRFTYDNGGACFAAVRQLREGGWFTVTRNSLCSTPVLNTPTRCRAAKAKPRPAASADRVLDLGVD